MRFLVTMGASDTMRTFPLSVIRQILTGISNVLNRWKDEGKIIENYGLPLRSNGSLMFIIECESLEEFYKYINDIPSAALWNMTTEPLIDSNYVFEIIMQNLDKGDEIMPGGSVKKEG